MEVRRPDSMKMAPTKSCRRVRMRVVPEPSIGWSMIGGIYLGIAGGTATASLTLSPDSAVSPLALLIVTGALVLLAVHCFLANWDANRGRRDKVYDLEEVDLSPPMPSEPSSGAAPLTPAGSSRKSALGTK